MSDAIGKRLVTTRGTPVSMGFHSPPGQPGGPSMTLAIEAGCNVGKSHAVFAELLRPRLVANPTTPVLFLSVRVTHALDLYATVCHYLMEGANAIPGVDIVCYKMGDGSSMQRVEAATQLVLSPETAEFAIKCGKLSADRFRGGVIVLDEVYSLAECVAGSNTVKDRECVAGFLREATAAAGHLVAMDRDITLTPLCSSFFAMIAPDRDVLHVQFTVPGQPGSQFCYASTAKGHDDGRIMQQFRLHCHAAHMSFEETPDDGTETGPKEWRRIFIGCMSKKKGAAVQQLIRDWGAPLSHIRFYHSDIGEMQPREGDVTAACKSDLSATDTTWRNVRYVICTPTVTVGVNFKLSFHSRWLFTFSAGSEGRLTSTSSGVMQMMMRVPRGTPEQQAAQLVDHKIYVAMHGNFPAITPQLVAGGLPPAAVNAKRCEIQERGARARSELARAATAVAQCHGTTPAAPLLASGCSTELRSGLVQLQAIHAAWRADHVGGQHVVRMMQIGAIQGYKEPTPIPALTSEQFAKLLQVENDLTDAAAADWVRMLHDNPEGEVGAAAAQSVRDALAHTP